MFDVEKLLGQMLSGGMRGGRRERRSNQAFGIPGVSKAQLGVGAIGIAIAAWEHFKSRETAATPATGAAAPMPPPPPPPPPFGNAGAAPAPMPPTVRAGPNTTASAAPVDSRQADAAHLIRAMIAAANADGQIDAQERAGILERALEAGLDTATQQFLMGELRAPASLDDIVAATRAELRLETYAAAVLAVSVDTDAERVWLDRLAAALALTAEDRQRVHEQLGI